MTNTSPQALILPDLTRAVHSAVFYKNSMCTTAGCTVTLSTAHPSASTCDKSRRLACAQMANYTSLRLLVWMQQDALLMSWKRIRDAAFLFYICMCLLLTEKVPVTIMKTDLLCLKYLCWLCLFASSSARVTLVLHSQSAGNIIGYLFCQPNTELRGCLCDLEVVVMNI